MSVLHTERLILRPFKETDAPAMYRNWTYDERVARYCRWYPHESIKVTEELLTMYLDNAAKGFEYQWAITLKGSDEPVGGIDVVDITEDGCTAEMGYVLSYEHWNKGYITEALSAVIEHLFSRGFTSVIACHHVDNPASGRVMEKCGMRYFKNSRGIAKFGSKELCDVKYYKIEK